MRLKCEVQVTNRLLPSLNIRKPCRPSFSQVSIGRKPGLRNLDGPIYLMLCTTQNRSGTKYVIHNNIEQIFSKFAKEGKATLRIKSPPDDIALSKADVAQLVTFLKILRIAAEGKKEFPERMLSPLIPAGASEVAKPVKSLVVDCPSKYPLSYPKTLETLTIQHCALRRLSPQVTQITSLCVLNLSYNDLSELPASFSALRLLCHLDLSHNNFVKFPNVVTSEGFCQRLSFLDMKDNLLQSLGPDFCKLVSLQALNLNCNKLRYLPEQIGCLPKLSTILVSNNLLEILPCTLVMKLYYRADFSDNPFTLELPRGAYVRKRARVPTLREAAGKAVLAYGIPYTEEDLDRDSSQFLTTAHYCTCGLGVFHNVATIILTHNLNAHVNCGNDELPFIFYCCSIAYPTRRNYICFRRSKDIFQCRQS